MAGADAPRAPTPPWLAPHAARLAALGPLAPDARLARLDAWARESGLRTASGRPVRFVAADDAPDVGRASSGVHSAARASSRVDAPDPTAPPDADRPGYEARIDATGEVPTRTRGRGARHDLYNALAWLAWPRTKARLNALHALGLATHAGTGRGGLRDALTVIDENAVAWVGLDAELEAMLRAFDWRRLFVEHRARLQASVALHVLGHALLEKLDAPFKAATAHAWPLRLPHDAPPAEVDAALARALDPSAIATRALCPLPVMGWPEWCDANRDPAFYNDPAVFRPGRRSASRPPR